jgi:hypothetical protein
MTQEDKMLLIKDLSARLPYAVTVEHTSGFRGTLHDITVHHMYDDNDNIYDAICYTDFFGDEDNIYIEYFKPYLFPLSSMTKEQKREYDKIIYHSIELHHREYSDIVEIDLFDDLQDFYCKNHLDYRGLIEKGLALDATGLDLY